MHERDRDTWRAIDSGGALITWQALFGHPDGADYLTQQGKAAAEMAVHDLEDYFGPGWVNRAAQPRSGRGPLVPALVRSSPVLSPYGPAAAYTELVRWWACLSITQKHGVPGWERVRRETRRDVTLDRFLHTLTQTRLAALGLSAGAEIELEPGSPNGIGDVSIEIAGTRTVIEVVTLSAGTKFDLEVTAFDDHGVSLDEIARRNDMHWAGEVPEWLNQYAKPKWRAALEDAARECVRTQQVVPVLHESFTWSGSLQAVPGPVPVGTTVSGPQIQSDEGSRLNTVLAKKGKRTRGADNVWIWAEDHGALGPLVPFSSLPLLDRVEAFATQIAPVLNDYGHIAGVVLSSTGRRFGSLPAGEEAETTTGLGLRLDIPLDRFRVSVISRRSADKQPGFEFMKHICANEPTHLEWVLSQFGYDNGLSGLLHE